MGGYIVGSTGLPYAIKWKPPVTPVYGFVVATFIFTLMDAYLAR
jgi:hypothetical protein